MESSIVSREIDPQVASAAVCPVEHGEKNLVAQADGLGRAAVMKNVVGPHLDALFRPVYAPDLGAAEKIHLSKSVPAFERFRDLQRFSGSVRGILRHRFNELAGNGGDFKQFLELNDERDDLFHFQYNPLAIVREVLDSSVTIPLVVASQIHAVEKGEHDVFHGGNEPITAQSLADIMERDSFDEILLHLTKGPNGFLGTRSTEIRSIDAGFFDFSLGGKSLRIDDTYELHDGRVVGLSNSYHLAASEKRKERRRNYEHVTRFAVKETHKGMDSSGCPVRHSFTDPETGEPQEPLVITAKKFLVAALRANQQQPQQEAA